MNADGVELAFNKLACNSSKLLVFGGWRSCQTDQPLHQRGASEGGAPSGGSALSTISAEFDASASNEPFLLVITSQHACEAAGRVAPRFLRRTWT